MKRPFFLGSLPFLETTSALQFVERYSSSLPFLPQLPERSSEEDMMAQVISNLDRGYWNEESSACLKPFLEKFGSSAQVKIQMVGPEAIARTMSSSYEQVWPLWFQFAQGIVAQMEGLGLSADLWIQIDEPYWSRERSLHPEYAILVCSLRGIRRRTLVGINSSHAERPVLEARFASFCDFLSLNFLERPLVAEDRELWKKLFQVSQTRLVAGVLRPGVSGAEDPLSEFGFLGDRLWIAAPGGLSDWGLADLETTFGSLSFLPVAGDVARVSGEDGQKRT